MQRWLTDCGIRLAVQGAGQVPCGDSLSSFGCIASNCGGMFVARHFSILLDQFRVQFRNPTLG